MLHLLFLLYSHAPGEDYSLYVTGKNLSRNEQWQEAAASYRTLLSRFPQSPYVHPSRYFLAYCLYNQGMKKDAFAELQILLRNPKGAQTEVVSDATALSLKVAFSLAGEDPTMKKYLVGSLSNPLAEIAFEAACFLAELNDGSGVAVLLRKVEQEKDSILRDRAVRYVLKVGSEKEKAELDAILKKLQGQQSQAAPKMVRLLIRDIKSGQDSVKVNVPISLFHILIRSLSDEQKEMIQQSRVDLNQLAASLKDIKPGTTIVEVRDQNQEIRILID